MSVVIKSQTRLLPGVLEGEGQTQLDKQNHQFGMAPAEVQAEFVL